MSSINFAIISSLLPISQSSALRLPSCCIKKGLRPESRGRKRPLRRRLRRNASDVERVVRSNHSLARVKPVLIVDGPGVADPTSSTEPPTVRYNATLVIVEHHTAMPSSGRCTMLSASCRDATQCHPKKAINLLLVSLSACAPLLFAALQGLGVVTRHLLWFPVPVLVSLQTVKANPCQYDREYEVYLNIKMI